MRRSWVRLFLDIVFLGGYVGIVVDGDVVDWCFDVFDVGRVVEVGVVYVYDVVGFVGFGFSLRLVVRL